MTSAGQRSSNLESSSASVVAIQVPFVYNDRGFQVQVGKSRQAFLRLPSKELYKLVNSATPYKIPESIGTHVDASAFFQSQAIHYGLPAMGQLSNVIEMLKRAFKVKNGEGTIAIPAALVAIRRKLQEEYESEVKERREKHHVRITIIKEQLVAIQKSKESEAALRKELEELEERIGIEVEKPKIGKHSRDEGGEENRARVLSEFVHEERRHLIPKSTDHGGAPAIQKRRKIGHTNDPSQKHDQIHKMTPSSQQTANASLEQGAVSEEPLPVISLDQCIAGTVDSNAPLKSVSLDNQSELVAAFHGCWKIGMPSAAQRRPSRDKLVIGKIFNTASRKSKTGQNSAKSIKVIVGHLTHSGKVYLLTTCGNDPLKDDLHIIGDTLKVSFAWHLVCNGGTKLTESDCPKHGMLDIFFNGTTVDIYGIGGISTGAAVESQPRVQDFDLKTKALRSWCRDVKQLQSKLESKSKEMAKKKSHKKGKPSKKSPAKSGRPK